MPHERSGGVEIRQAARKTTCNSNARRRSFELLELLDSLEDLFFARFLHLAREDEFVQDRVDLRRRTRAAHDHAVRPRCQRPVSMECLATAASFHRTAALAGTPCACECVRGEKERERERRRRRGRESSRASLLPLAVGSTARRSSKTGAAPSSRAFVPPRPPPAPAPPPHTPPAAPC